MRKKPYRDLAGLGALPDDPQERTTRRLALQLEAYRALGQMK